MNLVGTIALPVAAGIAVAYGVREVTESALLGGTAGAAVAIGGWVWLGRLWLASLTGRPW